MKKNILLISFDDSVSYWPIRSAFGEELRIPNLDRICETATAFQAAYCQAPVCGPSRASFMSGLTPHQTGVFDNSVDVFDVLPARYMFSARLKGAGWYCSSGGKVHHRYRPLRPFAHSRLYTDERKQFLPDMSLPAGVEAKRYEGHRGGWGTTNPADDVTYYDHQSASSAIDFLTSYQGEAPFYREVGFYSPHGPHITPARFKEMYDAGAFREPEAWARGFDCDAQVPELASNGSRFSGQDPAFWQACVRNYFSALSHGDYHLGRVWDALQASRFADNTLVILVSDHGFHLGERGRFSKFTMFEQVARVPLIIYDPSSRQGQVVSDPVSMLDLAPTILDYAGLAPTSLMTGRSLLPYLTGYRDPDRAVETVWDGGASIRKGRYRLIRYASGATQLFDVEADYWQQDELGPQHPAFAGMLAALEAAVPPDVQPVHRPDPGIPAPQEGAG